MIIGVDADITFFKSGDAWFKWLCHQTYRSEDYINKVDEPLPYDLSGFFGLEYEDSMEFWRQPNLYDNMPILEGAIATINTWIIKGHEVGFISYCKSGHFANKCDKLKEIFPDLAFINVTKEKQYSKVDVMIDDRVEYLENFDSSVTKILIQSKYAQNKPIPKDFIVCKDWFEIREFIK